MLLSLMFGLVLLLPLELLRISRSSREEAAKVLKLKKKERERYPLWIGQEVGQIIIREAYRIYYLYHLSLFILSILNLFCFVCFGGSIWGSRSTYIIYPPMLSHLSV